MTTTPMTTPETLEALQARRAELVLALAEGDEQVRTALDAIEAELDRRRLAAERGRLAEGARRERDQHEADQTEQARRREAELRRLYEERHAAAKAVEEALGVLRARVDTLLGIGTAMYGMSAQIGEPKRRFQLDHVIGLRLVDALWPLTSLVLTRPEKALRGPLTEHLPLETPRPE